MKGVGVGAGALAASSFVPGGLQRFAAGEIEQQPMVDEVVPSACWIGKQDCGMLARRVNGRVVKFEGHPADPRNVGTLCPKGMAQITALYDPARLKTPLVRTNEKGTTGEWREATWDEALELVADRIKQVREKDPSLILWQKGRSKAKLFYDNAFVHALEAEKLGHGGYCSDAGYRALEYTLGLHGVLHPDMPHTQYLLNWGWNTTGGGGNKFCWIVWNRQLVDARERGVKLVVIDPRLRGAGPFVDEWLPIRPGTDMALALALTNVLLEQGFVDVEYLTNYTNAPFLVKEDGYFLRVDEAEQVWDTKSGKAVPFDAAGADVALEGEYQVDGEAVKPAFQVLKEHVEQHTPEWAADVTGLDAESIRKVAMEFGQNARIGSTIKLDGITLPYRPVGAMAYHMSQQDMGMQTLRAMLFPFMLVGAVGAVGGQLGDTKWKIHKNYEALDDIEITDSPNFYLKNSRFYPINTGLPSVAAQVLLDPDKYGVTDLPELMILHMVNPLGAFPDQKLFMEAYEKIPFVADISPWLSETADYFADVILPAATVEKYEGPISTNDGQLDGVGLRVPPMEPLFESRGEIDIYLDLTEKADLLYGEGGYLEEINLELGLTEEDEETEELVPGKYALPLNKKPTVREIFDRWARNEDIAEGVAYFEKNGIKVKGPISADAKYGYATDPPFGGALHRLYGESLLRYREEMQKLGSEEVYWRDYTPLPVWRAPTMEDSPPEYDLYLITYKLIEHKQARSSFMPLLKELAREQSLAINPEAAESRGIEDGDEVLVESQNSVTGETRSVKTKAALTDTIRPDTVGMAHHFGLWANQAAEGQGPSPNEILFGGEGYVSATADATFQVKVRVEKA